MDRGVDGQHFYIQLDEETGTVLLSDASSAGTWILDSKGKGDRNLHQSTIPLLGDTRVRVGLDLDFTISPTTPTGFGSHPA